MHDIEQLKKSRDLSTSSWGPYSKKYMGISHIADQSRGFRFDISVFPGLYRRRIDVPNVRWESGYHPWEASTDLETFSVRHEIEWKDKVYCQITYSKVKENLRLVECRFVNNTETEQNLVLHTMASMNYPEDTKGVEWTPTEIQLPANMHWVDALTYKTLTFSDKKHDEHLVYDGMLRGEEKRSGFVGARCIGKGFGKTHGDCVSYNIESKTLLLLRGMVEEGQETVLEIHADEIHQFDLQGTGQVENYILNVSTQNSDVVKIMSKGGEAILIDGLVSGDENLCEDELEILEREYNSVPSIKERNGTVILSYEDIEQFYGIKWFYPDYKVREVYAKDLDSIMRFKVNDHGSTIFRGEGKGHYTNIFLRPIFLEGNETKTIYGLVACDDSEEKLISKLNEQSLEELQGLGKKDFFTPQHNTCGNQYAFSQQLMGATMLTNTVYPVSVEKEFIKHNTPGRWWDCLYTWDSGFIGIGFTDIDINRAIECLNTYVTDYSDSQRAFIHHGTPLPVQVYLLAEIWNRTQDKQLLEYFYPRVKHFYEFIVCRDSVSTTDQYNSRLLQTWDYFYNSGGWDDYPPQHSLFTVDKAMIKHITPSVVSSHAIRCAKILSMLAKELSIADDLVDYDQDIQRLSQALLKHSWDEESGYFSYVLHDESGNPKGFYDHKGENFNKGLDGVAPLLAGICNEEQEVILLNHLKSDKELWTSIGLSTVDQSAGYYKKDGYWNGAVWMPHQWFMWKTMLDLGESDFAYKIASTALDLWEREVQESYNCFEHFIIQTGRGAGWHQFGGLSSPVINWFASYNVQGTITAGFNALITDKEINDECSELKVCIQLHDLDDKEGSIIIVMNENYHYEVYLNNELTTHIVRYPGTLEIPIGYNQPLNSLLVKKKNRE